jgi:hypothetical protein
MIKISKKSGQTIDDKKPSGKLVRMLPTCVSPAAPRCIESRFFSKASSFQSPHLDKLTLPMSAPTKINNLNQRGRELNGMKLERMRPSMMPNNPIMTHIQMTMRQRCLTAA